MSLNICDLSLDRMEYLKISIITFPSLLVYVHVPDPEIKCSVYVV